MLDFDPELSVAVEGKEILVTLPGTNYAVTYFKRDGSFGLLAKDIVQEDDHRLPHMTAAQFLAKAWKLANEKASRVDRIKVSGGDGLEPISFGQRRLGFLFWLR